MNTQSQPPNYGKLLASYNRGNRTVWHRAGLVVLAVLTLSFIVLGTVRAFEALQTFGPAGALSNSKAWFLAAGIGVIALLGAWYMSSSRRPVVSVYERALVLAGESIRQIPWTTISGVIFREVRYKMGRVDQVARLVLSNGEQLNLSNWIAGKSMNDLVVHIKARTYRGLDDSLRNQVQAGGWAEFGCLAVSNTGIKVNGIEHSWDEIRSLRIDEGILTIERFADHPYEIGVEQVTNPELLLRILSDLGGRNE